MTTHPKPSTRLFLLMLALCGFIIGLSIVGFFLFFHSEFKMMGTHRLPSYKTRRRLKPTPYSLETIRSNHRCNKYFFLEGGVETPTNTLMNTCHLENVCLTTSGAFVLFQKKDTLPAPHLMLSELNSKPWVYAQGTVLTDRGNFYVKVLDRNLRVEYGSDSSIAHAWGQNDENGIKEPIELHSAFSFVDGPVYAMKRYASGNVGHNFLQNINMVVSLMMNYKVGLSHEDMLDNRVLFLDDVLENFKHEHIGAWLEEYSGEQANKFSMQVAGLVSKHPVLQLCRKDVDGYSIQTAPCRNDKWKNMTETPMVLQTCFSEMYVGMSVDLLVHWLVARESIFINLRQLAYTRLGLYPLPNGDNGNDDYLRSKDIVIAIHKKSLSEVHGNAISNPYELLLHITKNLATEPFMKHLNRRVIVEFTDLKGLSIADQVKYFSKVDVYITDQGSAMYFGIFMRDDTSMLVAPICDQACRRGFNTLVDALANVHVKNVMDLASEQLECKERPTSSAPKNCDPILPPHLVYGAVTGYLKTRYRKFL